MKFFLILLLFSFADRVYALENQSCVNLFSNGANLPVLSPSIPPEYIELIEQLEEAKAITLAIHQSKEQQSKNFNEVLYAALPSLMLTLTIIQKNIGGLNGIKLAAHYLELIIKHQDNPTIVSKIHDDFIKQYHEIKNIRSKKTDKEKLTFIATLSSRYSRNVIRFLQNLIQPQTICKAKEVEASASFVLSLSGSLGLVVCTSSNGKKWLELSTGINPGIVGVGTSFKFRNYTPKNFNLGKIRTYWNDEIEIRGSKHDRSTYENISYDYTYLVTRRDAGTTQTEQISIGAEILLTRSFFYSYFPIPILSLDKKILLQSLFDFESLSMYGFNSR